MYKTKYHITKMDCPSEERMIRMKLEPFTLIKSMQFDIPDRTLEIYHEGDIKEAEDALYALKLDTEKNRLLKLKIRFLKITRYLKKIY